jgi:antitoxin VapB
MAGWRHKEARQSVGRKFHAGEFCQILGQRLQCQMATVSLGHWRLGTPVLGITVSLILDIPAFGHMLPAYAKCESTMSVERRVKLFRNGRNQAVRIPREFELPGEDAIIRKEGERLIIEVSPPKSLLAVLASLSSLNEDFPSIADPVPNPVDL